MRYADDQDLGSDGFSEEERKKYRALDNASRRTQTVCRLIVEMQILARRCSLAAVPALERAEANVVTAIEEMRRDLAVMMGDE